MTVRVRVVAVAAVLIAAAGCEDATSPNAALVYSRTPDLIATVEQVTYESGWVPAGFWMSQHDVWIAVPPSDTANAGVVVGDKVPVFLSMGVLGTVRTTVARIHVGDLIEVWRDPVIVYGAVQSPPGSPCYEGIQVVILQQR